jgi:hypothetical protein
VNSLSPLGGLILTLALAYGFDRWLASARNAVQARVSVTAYQWAVSLANLLFAVCALGLAWLALRQPGNARRAWAALFLAIGVIVIVLPAPPLWSLGPNVPVSLLYVVQASPHSFFGMAGAFLAVIGLAGLFLPRTTGPAGR